MLGTKASKNPVQDALDLVNRYDKSGASKYRDSQPSVGDVKQQDRQKSLKGKLIASKQRVVHHLRVSRSIECSIVQTEVVDKAIKAQLANRVERDSTGKVADRIREAHSSTGTSITQSWLENYDLRAIEDQLMLEPGHANIVQNTLNRYDDSKLCKELSGMPRSSHAKMDKALFAKVAMLTSKTRLNGTEAGQLFAAGERLVERAAEEQGLTGEELNDVKWELLCALLRSQLLKMELARALMNAVPALHGSMSLSTLSTSTSMRGGGPHTVGRGQGKVPDGASLAPGSLVSWENETVGEGSMLLSPSKSLVPGQRDKGNSPLLRKYANLKGKFDQSQSRQLELSDQIVANLSQISQSVQIDGSEHASALAFAKRIAVRKFEGVLGKIVVKALRIAVKQWWDVLKFHRYQEAATTSMRAFGTFKLFYFVEKSFNDKLRRGMKRLKKRIEWYQDMEQLSAVAELQRYWRGCLCRKRLNNKVRNYAATQIMRIARGRQGRAYALKYAECKVLRGRALKIENAYMKYRWRRIRKNIHIFKIQKRMTERLQRVYRGHQGRKRVRRLRNQFVAISSCKKMQNAWRRYKATLVVDKKMRIRLRYRSAAKMQKLVRGVSSRKITVILRKRYRAARRVQCMIRCFLARAKRRQKYVTLCAQTIQRVFRGRVGRERFAWFLNLHLNRERMRNDALVVLRPLILGHRVRRKWGPVLTDYVTRRRNGSTVIQCLMRTRIALRRVNRLRSDRDNVELQILLAKEARIRQAQLEAECAREGQRVVRGFLGRCKGNRRRIEVEELEALRAARVPAYYRLREEYYRDQNMFHRPYLIRMQCAYRCMLARVNMNDKRRQKAALDIEYMWYSYIAIQDAKAFLANLREHRRRQNISAVHTQRIVRGYLGRYEAKKHEHTEIFKWFIGEVHSLGMIGRALQNFRVRKRTQDKINRQMTYAQALVRKFLTRCKFLRGYKRLLRDRDSRRKKKRVRACIAIQGFARIIKAQKIVYKRKLVIAEEKRMKGEEEELDRRIEGIHSDWEQDLLATRISTQVRGNMGKAQAGKKIEENKFEKEKREKQERAKAATRIQALSRGVRRRDSLIPQLPGLRAEKQKRNFCVECEANVAVKRCRTCNDRYCDACYIIIHRKGKRKNHSWEPIHQDSRSVGHSHPDTSIDKKSKRREAKGQSPKKQEQRQTIAKPSKSTKSEWVKYYDEAARAHYWFSEVSGEARWTDPNA